MKKIVSLTGANGNMGREALKQLAQLAEVGKIKILLYPSKKSRLFAAECDMRYHDKIEVIYGDIANIEPCINLVSNADYVVNMAAVIPPASDHKPDLADRCNRIGTENIVKAIKAAGGECKLVHISTVALYGHRNYLHPWGRVGDPLMPSVYDCYAASKLKGERYVLESGLKNWVVLRQTGILHDRMFADNMHDGLMFHTCINVPLEWITAHDSGVLIRNLIKKDVNGGIENFWRRVFNIGGGAENRRTGYDVFEGGFAIIGGSAEKFLKPGWNTIRNFHGVWFSDGDELNSRLDYVSESVDGFWQTFKRKHPYFCIAKLLPPSLISKVAFRPLLRDENSPQQWIENNDIGKITAFFGSRSNIECRIEKWSNFPVLAKGKLADEDVDYENMRAVDNVEENGYLLNHGYDENKPDNELGIEDMRSAAAFRGGECLSGTMTKGDLYTPLKWKCCDGHEFDLTPYAVLKAGHWCAECCQPEPWDYDRLSKSMPFFAQVWYDTHAEKEDYLYYFDGEGNACIEKR